MSRYENRKIGKFLDDLASGKPTPGGGSAAALSGALAASLVEMVCMLTITKKGYEDVFTECQKILELIRNKRKYLLGLSERDALAYEDVVSAYKTPKEEKGRKTKIQKALKHATLVPLDTATAANDVLEKAERMKKIGNKNAISDAKVAEYLCKASIAGALENVYINLESIENEHFRHKIEPTLKLLSKKVEDFVQR